MRTRSDLKASSQVISFPEYVARRPMMAVKVLFAPYSASACGLSLTIASNQSGEEAQEPTGSNDLQAALARELKGQVWDNEKETWAK